MNNKILAVAIVGVLVVASVVGILILTMGNTSSTEGKPNFVITSFGLSKHNVLVNNETTVTVELLNNGTADGTYRLNVTIDGAVVKSSSVAVGEGNTTTVSYNISSSVSGNHTVAVGANSTYLVCHDRFAMGNHMIYHAIESDTTYGVLEYNYTIEGLSANETSYTQSVTYENNVYAYQVLSYNKNDPWVASFENKTLVGLESVSTTWGLKTLSHWTYTFESNGYHYDVDTYRDDTTGASFRTVYRTDGFVGTDVLIDTDREWMKEI